MGLQFAYATEHGSNSEQLIDIDYLFSAPLYMTRSGLRDMSPARFTKARQWLYSADGAIAEAASYPWNTKGSQTLPQLFLGTEFDIIPEISASEKATGLIKCGNGKTYDIGSACTDYPDILKEWYVPTAGEGCSSAAELLDPTPQSTWMVRDLQGEEEIAFCARNHVLAIPTWTNQFFPSSTSKYGGGTRRFRDLLAAHFEQ